MKIQTLSTWLNVSELVRDTLRSLMAAEEAARAKGQADLAEYWHGHWNRLYDGADLHAEFYDATV